MRAYSSRATAELVFGLYALVFIVSGIGSIVFARAEMSLFFDMSPGDDAAWASLLNQYRFLRAIEVGFGLVMWMQRRAFFTDATARRVLLPVLYLIPCARGVGLFVDGWPSWPWVALMIVELGLAVWFTLVTRRRGRRR